MFGLYERVEIWNNCRRQVIGGSRYISITPSGKKLNEFQSNWRKILSDHFISILRKRKTTSVGRGKLQQNLYLNNRFTIFSILEIKQKLLGYLSLVQKIIQLKWQLLWKSAICSISQQTIQFTNCWDASVSRDTSTVHTFIFIWLD